MGLDQVAFLVPKDSNAVIVHDGSPPPINVVELVKDKYPDPNEAGITTLWRWRKHADLQAWMTRLFHHRGGDGDFNVAQDVRVEEIWFTTRRGTERRINHTAPQEALPVGFFYAHKFVPYKLTRSLYRTNSLDSRRASRAQRVAGSMQGVAKIYHQLSLVPTPSYPPSPAVVNTKYNK